MSKIPIKYDIVFVGAGRVAGHLSRALQEAGHRIIQVISRTERSARRLAERYHCAWSTDIGALMPEAQLIIFSVRDDALRDLITAMHAGETLTVHTGGSIPLRIFEDHAVNYGVFYPLQTFSGDRTPDFRKIPLCIEANKPENERILEGLAKQISDVVIRADSQQRLTLHLAAIIANNFTNHLFVLAKKILEKEHLPFDLLQPLIEETVAKAFDLGPENAQTGPAARNDKIVLKKHLDLLSCSPEIQKVYEVLTESIRQRMNREK